MGILGFLLGINFNANYEVRSPIVERQPVTSPKPKTTHTPKVEVAYAEAPISGSELKTLVLSYFPANERAAADELIMGESTWNPHAINPSSGATGLFQALPWSKTGCSSTDDIRCQAAWGSAYISSRYGDSIKALRFHSKNGYY